MSLILAGSIAAPLEVHPSADPPGTRYFFLLFGGQSIPYKPRTAHTWATYVKATPTPGNMLVLESHTISWLPADGDVEVFRLRSTKGKNYTLAETMALARSQNARVSLWGPYEIDAERYQRAVAQAQSLESGRIRYRVFDSFGFNRRIRHCVHAVTYADPVLQYRVQPVLQVGEPGTSRLAARYLRTGAFIHPQVTHDWLIPALGLCGPDIVRRKPGEWIPREFR